jgi:hypothetical protein
MSPKEQSEYLGVATVYEAARFAIFPITYNLTKGLVDEICTHALGQRSRPLEPCYKRAAISGAIASLCSRAAADDSVMNVRQDARDQKSVISLNTLITIVGGGIAGVTIEAARAKREQRLVADIEKKHEEVHNMSAAELLVVIQMRHS